MSNEFDAEVLFKEFKEFRGQRVALRALNDEDASAIYEIFSDPNVVRFYGLEPMINEEQAKAVLRSLIDRFAKRRGVRWGITLAGSIEVIGTIGLQMISLPNARAEIGFDLQKKFWRQGFMSESINIILRFAFEDVGFNRIEGLCKAENQASIEILRKIGFQKEGVLRNYLQWHDGFHDMVLVSMLKNEFLSKVNNRG